MEKSVKRLFSHADRQKIEACVRRAESLTRGEIMVLVAAASHSYPAAALRAGLALASPVAVALTPVIGALLWVGPFNLWIFLGALIPLFFIFQAAVRHFPAVKRLFVSDREMEAEVQAAAENQFYQQGVCRTVEKTGILIYLSVFERKVRVLGDRGINARIPPGFWQHLVDTIASGIRSGRPADSICEAVAEVAGVLAEKFPVRAGDTDELENLVVKDRRP